MKTTIKFLTLLLLLSGLWALPAHAQTDACPAIVQSALAQVDQACTQTARGQACYGNFDLNAVPQPGTASFVFRQPGDLVEAGAIQTLTLEAMDTVTQSWGVALLRLQANLPDSLPGQNVTFLLFGDVEIENATGPTTPGLTPLQAFFFRSGIGDAACSAAPDSGIVIQTPEGAGLVTMTVNGANITLGSTAFLQAELSGEMTVNLIDGQGLVSAFGSTQALAAGQRVRLPMGPEMGVSGPPAAPEPSDPQVIERLPLDILDGGGAQPELIEPCSVATTVEGAAPVHVGPGRNRTVILFMPANRNFLVTGQTEAADGTLWWELDKEQVAPGRLVNGTWVADSDVTTIGGCNQVGAAVAPPIVPLPQPTTPTPQPQPIATEEPLPPVRIEFGANPLQIMQGECTAVFWDVEGIRTVRYEGMGVTGQGSRVECPLMTTIYTLSVTLVTGEIVTRTVTITVM